MARQSNARLYSVRFAGVVLVLALLAAGCRRSASEPPPLEQSPAERAKLLTLPDEYRSMANPLPASERNVLEGRDRYLQYCAACHGADGRGNTLLGRNLYPPASDITAPRLEKYSDGQLFWIISEGVRFSGMPGGRAMHTEDQMWKLVMWVRQLR